ncbi:hypothetical protein CDAR_609231 [Caerostris darwini]|uniref:Uncharacterized protein n=1 Tax=Caerostris darwini TaxID=1538125 RepID=A0AAV4PRF3_9ARAC|nr:hypothetical protein CDAR_609231 [Caerostris darwini]
MANSVRGPRFWGGGGYLSFRNCPKSYLNCVGEENGAVPLRGIAPVSFAARKPFIPLPPSDLFYIRDKTTHKSLFFIKLDSPKKGKKRGKDLLFDLSPPEEEVGFNWEPDRTGSGP